MRTSIKALAHPFDDARALADQTIGLLVDHRTAPHPVNFTVAYAYFGGASADLVDALDRQLRQGATLDEAVLHELFDQYIATERISGLSAAGSGLHVLLTRLAEHLGEAGADVAAFCDQLDHAAGALRAAPGVDALQALVAGLIDSTLTLRRRQEQLTVQIKSSQVETELLREELEEHRRAALIDPLTGLLNRRAMEARFDELLSAPRAAVFSVLMIDIDDFKSINDLHGHALGDAVIRNVAAAIRKCIRGADPAVRYGGEEFLVILPDTPPGGAARVAESIRVAVASLRLVRKRDNFQLRAFTVSIGVTTSRDGDAMDAILHRADQALYRSKQSGKNRVSVVADA
ncbi:diguanylate cyclase VdcA [mine drainage metagenome]|jgi:diguanylate cyclase|uniref:Diguanylate cyclase VdcA n=1 Tax=mine drainage metagenome TaxID=410659 RepID=A0A1J5QBY8_9ZZZZ